MKKLHPSVKIAAQVGQRRNQSPNMTPNEHTRKVSCRCDLYSVHGLISGTNYLCHVDVWRWTNAAAPAVWAVMTGTCMAQPQAITEDDAGQTLRDAIITLHCSGILSNPQAALGSSIGPHTSPPKPNPSSLTTLCANCISAMAFPSIFFANAPAPHSPTSR